MSPRAPLLIALTIICAFALSACEGESYDKPAGDDGSLRTKTYRGHNLNCQWVKSGLSTELTGCDFNQFYTENPELLHDKDAGFAAHGASGKDIRWSRVPSIAQGARIPCVKVDSTSGKSSSDIYACDFTWVHANV
jgi:hypothetical protein